MRLVATTITGAVGLALATWGVIELRPADLQADPADTAPAPGIVRSIRFRGDVDPVGMRSQLHTRIGAAIEPTALAADRARVEAALVMDGHLDAHVDVSGDVDVLFAIDAGPVYRLGAVALTGGLAAKYPALADELTVGAGDDVSVRAIDRTEERLATWLAVHGVAHAPITHHLDVDRAARRVDVTYDVSPPARAMAARRRAR